MRRKVILNCPICGKGFQTWASQYRVYCSKVCHNKAMENRIEKTCPVCQEPFKIPASYANRFIVCSIKCRLAFTQYRQCLRCGKTFRAGAPNRKYCSEICRRPPITTICENCGKKFRHIPSISPHFCSFACYRSFIGKNGGETSIEVIIRTFLDTLPLPYQQEAQIGRYAVDFLIPSLNLVIECDGIYWHRDKRRDIAKNHFLKKQGYQLLRLSEDSITSGKATQLILTQTNNHNLHLFK